MKRDSAVREALNWVLRYLVLDIDKLPDPPPDESDLEARRRELLESEAYRAGEPDAVDEMYRINQQLAPEPNFKTHGPNQFYEEIEHLFIPQLMGERWADEKVPSPKPYRPSKKDLAFVQKELAAYFDQYFLSHPGSGGSDAAASRDQLGATFAAKFTVDEGRGLFILTPHFEDKRPVRERLVVLAKTRLASLLDGVSRADLKQCPACRAYFLPATKRKIYCNPVCTNRASARAHRERDPEGYKRKQRAIMKKRRKAPS